MFCSLRLQNWEKEAIRPNGVLKYFSGLFYEAFTHTKEMKKIEAGFLIKEILDRFTSKSQSLLEPDRKLFIYSAHDLTIANVLNALNLFEDVIKFFYSYRIPCNDRDLLQVHIPPYASSMYFELYKRGSEYFVQLFYRRIPTELVLPLRISKCGFLCPLKRLYEIYKEILPTEDHATICQLTN